VLVRWRSHVGLSAQKGGGHDIKNGKGISAATCGDLANWRRRDSLAESPVYAVITPQLF